MRLPEPSEIHGDLYDGVYWVASGTVHALCPIFGGLTTLVMAHGISNNGWIAGGSQDGAPNYYGHAVIWWGHGCGWLGGYLAYRNRPCEIEPWPKE